MSTLKKAQHYVWQHYLKPWTVSGTIYCLRQKEGKIFGSNTKNVASESFFYKAERLTNEDLEYLNKIIDRVKSPEIRDVHKGTIRMFQLPFILRDAMHNAPSATKKKLNALLDDAEKTIGESYHTFVEQKMVDRLSDLRMMDCRFYENSEEVLDFVNFITNQFFRTPKLKVLTASFQNPFPNLDLRRTWLIESQIYAVNVAAAIYSEHKLYRFCFIDNKTSTPFITGDQPVLNLNNHLNQDIRLYYPLSPKLAVIFWKGEAGPLRDVISVNESAVDFYNRRILWASTDQIYGSDKHYLKTVSQWTKEPPTTLSSSILL